MNATVHITITPTMQTPQQQSELKSLIEFIDSLSHEELVEVKRWDTPRGERVKRLASLHKRLQLAAAAGITADESPELFESLMHDAQRMIRKELEDSINEHFPEPAAEHGKKRKKGSKLVRA